ncbi:MAG: hypothetical protein AAF609_03315 [Cyanobacteria bacterium P01_C01_bin.120]
MKLSTLFNTALAVASIMLAAASYSAPQFEVQLRENPSSDIGVEMMAQGLGLGE